MKKIHKMLILAALAALASGSVLLGAERGRNGRLRGTFVGLTEREVGERGYVGIVIKPMDSDEHVTVLIPRNNERLMEAAHNLRQGQRLGISFVIEDDFRWAGDMEVERRRGEVEPRPRGDERVIVRREVRRDGEPAERQRLREERPLRGEPQAERERFRDREDRDFPPEPDIEREPFRGRQDRPGPWEPPYPERIDAQLREIVQSHMESMHRVLREVFMANLERTEAELRELRGHVERMERQMQELREENERLRMELRERDRVQREEVEARQRREPDRPREGRAPREREVQRDRERRGDLDRPAEERPREERPQEEPEEPTGR